MGLHVSSGSVGLHVSLGSLVMQMCLQVVWGSRSASSERGFQTHKRDIARSREKQRDRGSNGAISNNEMTEKNLVETHEGGLEQDDAENKNKLEEALGAGAKVLD